MIDFAIIALPRSGTAWASVWLDAIHDPLATITLNELKNSEQGLSCTALWLHPEFIYDNIKRWIILENDPAFVNKWAVDNGYQPMPQEAFDKFFALRGPRMHYSDLFNTDKAKHIWKYLKPDSPFDEKRHNHLKIMNIQTTCSYV